MNVISRTLILASLSMAVPIIVSAQNGACTPSTPLGKQKRTEMKHRVPASSGTHVTHTSISEMLAWEQPSDLSDQGVRNSNSAIDPREEDVFDFQGDLWRIAQEPNDCDFHLELSAPGGLKTADRVIVEIPMESPYPNVRQAVLSALSTDSKNKLESEGEVLLTTPIHMKVTGFAFFDAFHYTATYDPARPGRCKFTKAQKLQRGNNHGTCAVGTIWELHPVWKVVVSSTP